MLAGIPSHPRLKVNGVTPQGETGKASGLTTAAARERLRADGPNAIAATAGRTPLAIAVSQVASPFVLILVAAALLSAATGDGVQATIILAIVLLSAALGFMQEARSEAAVSALRERLALRATVIRDGSVQEIPVRDLVVGDVIHLGAGDVVPADGQVLEANHLFVDEAALTGESNPAPKQSASGPAADPSSAVASGTSVVSGTGVVVLTATGSRTAYGAIARRLVERSPETDFQHGVRAFGLLIARFTLILVIAVLAVNLLFNRPLVESLLFAIALAVGLTPELLPAIVTFNLSRGARHLAANGVLVKRLPAIQNLGSMTILCTDKTGTVTEGRLGVERAIGADGAQSADVLELAYLNSHFQTGFQNPLDDAITSTEAGPTDLDTWAKVAELPYDFQRRCLSVLLQREDGTLRLITKGAPADILARSTSVGLPSGAVAMDEMMRARVNDLIGAAAAEGYRAIAVASKTEVGATSIAAADEEGLTFAGLILLSDPPKSDVSDVLRRLHDLGVSLKIVTGDDPLIAQHVAGQVGLQVDGILTGDDLAAMTHDAFVARAQTTTIFARVNPDQKLQIIRALRERGAVVGYMGDGINDAPPLHVADVGISVDNATDVARAAADIVLLQSSLEAVAHGISEGRRTFANTLKYIRMGTSSNFGNMFSMAGSALLLPFLPMLPSQILLNNLIYDASQTALPSDSVDPEVELQPARWDVGGIERFMVIFGPISSVFDFITFGLLYVVLKADEATFHTGWFVESLFTQILVVLVIRTRRTPFWRSRPSPQLVLAIALSLAVAVLLPVSPFADALGFKAPPLAFGAMLIALVVVYLFVVEAAKRIVFGDDGTRDPTRQDPSPAVAASPPSA